MPNNNAYDENNRKSYVKVGRIYNALKHLHVIYLENLLKTEGDINYRILVGTTRVPNLLYKALDCEYECLDLLLEYGADFTYKDEGGKTIVHRLIERYLTEDKINYIDSILEAHVKFNNPSNPADENGMTHFHVACKKNNVAAVEFFLKNGVDVNHAVNADSPIFPKYTPLHFAVKYPARANVAAILLNYGANMHLKNDAGLSPLHVCVKQRLAIDEHKPGQPYERSPSGYNEILKNFAYFVNDQPMNRVEDVDDFGFCILHAVCLLRDEFIVEKIIEKTEDISQAVNFDSPIRPGYTALHFAAFSKVEIFKLLLDNGADIEAKNRMGETPLDICLRHYSAQDIYSILMIIPKWRNIIMSDDKTKLVSIVFDMKNANEPFAFPSHATTDFTVFVPFDSPLWPGCTLLHLAVMFARGKLGIAKIRDCLERGADTTAKNAKGLTPLKLAAHMEKIEIVECLQGSPMVRRVTSEEGLLNFLALDCGGELLERDRCPYIDDDLLLLAENLKNGMGPSQDEHFLNRLAKIFQYLTKEDEDFLYYNKKSLSKFYSSASTAFKGMKHVKGNPTDKHGISVFHLACLTGNADIVKKFFNHGVDVNQTISYFSDDCPGSTALHLVLRNYGRKYKLSSSSAFRNQTVLRLVSTFSDQTFLRIVDVLLSNGADVDAADAFGETPLFQAIRLPTPNVRQIVINKLISYGANIHVANVKGNTPFELSLNCRCSWEEIQVFLKAGCIFDSYNPITQEGYMSIVFRSHLASQTALLKNRACREIISDPKIIEVNDLGRTAIHNVVSTGLVELSYSENRRYYWRTLEEEEKEEADKSAFYRTWSELIELLVERGSDIDQQDNEGKTALHLAVLHDNVFGVYGLLKNGADVNLTDNNRKTIFADSYSSPESSDTSSESSDTSIESSDTSNESINTVDVDYDYMRVIFAVHLYKLNFCGERVSEQHEKLKIEAECLKKFKNDQLNRFHAEIKKSMSMKIGKTFEISVYEFLMRNDVDIVYANMTQAERIEIDQFFEDIGKYKFEEIDCLLNLKYRRNIERVKLIEPALESFNVLIKYQLPDLCCRYIMKFLRNRDLKQLIASTI